MCVCAFIFSSFVSQSTFCLFFFVFNLITWEFQEEPPKCASFYEIASSFAPLYSQAFIIICIPFKTLSHSFGGFFGFCMRIFIICCCCRYFYSISWKDKKPTTPPTTEWFRIAENCVFHHQFSTLFIILSFLSDSNIRASYVIMMKWNHTEMCGYSRLLLISHICR